METEWLIILMAATWDLFTYPINILGYDTSPLMLMIFLLVLTIIMDFILHMLGIKDKEIDEATK